MIIYVYNISLEAYNSLLSLGYVVIIVTSKIWLQLREEQTKVMYKPTLYSVK